jgi:predicted Zn-dependent protease
VSKRSFGDTPASILADEQDVAFMTKEAAIALGEKILKMAKKADQMQVVVNRTQLSATRFALSKVTGGSDGAKTTITVSSYIGFKGGTAVTDKADEESLRKCVAQAEELAEQYRSTPEGDELTEVFDVLPDSKLWHPSTVAAMTPENRGDVTHKLIESVEKTKDVMAAGYLAFRATGRLIMNTSGLTCYDKMTDSECTMTARTKDGSGSGWAGGTMRDWSRIDPAKIASRAIKLAEDSKNPYTMEPGRHTAILTATAMGQLLQHFMWYAMGAFEADMGMTVFSKKPKGNKWGMKVLDSRISLVSDPEDPDGGYPFFDDYGLPLKKTTWVDKGYLRQLVYYPGYGRGTGHATCPNPHSIRLTGTELMGMEEMISKVQNGFLINRFSSLSMFNQKSLMMSGTTRDGLMYIKDGKINRSAKNMRFMDSMMFFLNNMIGIGPSERISVGWSPEFESQGLGPVISAPVLVKDFSFTALADAI